jgi:uncharacterized protein YbjT (DUF2867 family)
MRILVTGASGFAGSLLIGRLRRSGHEVVALGRDPQRVAQALKDVPREDHLGDLRLLRGDILTGAGLAAAMDGVEVAYYLIHSMEPAPAGAGAFAERERIAARTFAAQAARSRVRRIVYLGGLLPRESASAGARTRAGASGAAHTDDELLLSPHLASRRAVERILREAVPDSVVLRASIVIGARSRSFRLLVRLVERLPVLALPAWRRYRTQPIDARDVTEMLAAAAAAADVGGRSLDIGGPDVLSYGDMIARIAELMLVRRPAIDLGVSITPLTARVAAAIAGEQPELVLPLMGSLRADLLPADDHAAERLNVELHSFDSAVEHALAEWEAREPLAAR